MLTEDQIVDRIIEIEAEYDPSDEFSYLDEGQQESLNAYYAVLDRELTKAEMSRVKKLRKELLGN